MSDILETGGAGYISSHVCVQLLENGYDILVVDHLRNSHVSALQRIEELSGRRLKFLRGDVGDDLFMRAVSLQHRH